MNTSIGGFLEIHVKIGEWVTEGEVLGGIKNIFNDRVSELIAPIDGLVCARNIKP